MSVMVMSLVILSSVFHAIWNLIAKRVSGGLHYAWLLWSLSALLLSPLALFQISQSEYHIALATAIIIILSSLLHAGYYLLLQQSYIFGDLSIVYPFTRGLGPLLSVLFAICILKERPSSIAIAGTVVVTIGIFILAGSRNMFQTKKINVSILYSFVTSVFIGAYLIVDKYAVGVMMISPILFSWSYELGRTLIMLPVFIKESDKIRNEINVHFKEAISMAFLGTLSYVLILFALQHAPLSYVAPARTLGVVFGTFLGGFLLKEEEMMKRVLASCVIVTGLVLLSVG